MNINIQGIVNQVTDDVMKRIADVAPVASSELKTASLEVLTGERHGRIYRRPGGGYYQASAPGEPPAERTGVLRQSWQPVPSGNQGINPCIESNVPYATIEFGSADGKVAPRPYADKIKERAFPQICALYERIGGS